jgi:membrane protein implicated in regulation of membrane protease activity
MLATTAYFIMGSIPLLLLKHDTPLDARFVRGFFNIYYVAAFVTAGATSISFAFAGHPVHATGAAALAVLAVVLRRKVIPKMDALGAQIQSNYMDSIPGFRRTHVTAIAINIAQLIAIVSSLVALNV